MNSILKLRGASTSLTRANARMNMTTPFVATFMMGRRYQSNKPQAQIELQHLGCSVDLYVHPVGRNLPSWFSSPLQRLKAVGRRLGMFFQNTVMIGQFRIKSKITPRFAEWKNLAIEEYTAVNRAFAKDDMDSVKQKCSIWVYESLRARRKSLPNGTKLEWQLLKFNSPPKVMCMQPMMLPNQPLHHIMIVYRMDTQQRMIKYSPGDSKAHRSERNVVDYIAFVYDASQTPADAVLAGSLFETPSTAPRPNPMAGDQSEKAMLLSMKEKGDIYRSPPVVKSV